MCIFNFLLVFLIPHSVAQVTPERVKAALEKSLDAMASLQNNGGWAYAWTDNGKAAFGQDSIQSHESIMVSNAVTPGMGRIFLRAYQQLENELYLGIAKRAGDALVRGQLDCGGFPKSITPDTPKDSPGIFEDNTTQNALQFLVELWNVTKDRRYAEAVHRCAHFMLLAQDEHGGFPQIYPLKDNEPRYIVLQGGAMADVIRSLLGCYEAFGDQEYYDAAIRGMNCLRALQSEPPQAGWSQYYTKAGRPVSMGNCSPVALSTVETVHIIQLFVEFSVHTKDKTYLQTIPSAVDWLNRSKLENGKWARFYAFGSNKEMYCNENQIEDVYEPHTKTNQQGEYFSFVLESLVWVLNDASPETIHEEYTKTVRDLKHSNDIEAIVAIVDALNGNGFWITPSSPTFQGVYRGLFGPGTEKQRIHAVEFVKNTALLLDFLESN